jgi:hypothetical protein
MWQNSRKETNAQPSITKLNILKCKGKKKMGLFVDSLIP